MSNRVDDRVVVIHVAPEVPAERLVPVAFAAAISVVGPGVICDVADGPRGSVLVHMSGAPVGSQALARRLRGELQSRLHVDGVAVDVHVLGGGSGTGAVVREMALQWIDRAGPDAFLSSRQNAYDAAIAELLGGDGLRIVFQPIVEAWSGRVIGFEALCRGPRGHILEMPDAFFDALSRSTLQAVTHLRLVQLARQRAATRFPAGDELLLFVNAPGEEHWPGVGQPGLSDLLPIDTWPWSRMVLEITEKSPVHDKESFAAVVGWGRNAGVRFALDDVGAGYAGLSAYALLQPEFTKVDMGLVRGCDRDPVRRAAIASLVALAHRTGSQVIAEGVESAAELETVRWLGVDLVQGFVIAQPSETPDTLHHPWMAATPQRQPRQERSRR